jgi:hypothetical protein
MKYILIINPGGHEEHGEKLKRKNSVTSVISVVKIFYCIYINV